MKAEKKSYVVLEAVLSAIVIAIIFIMLVGKTEKKLEKVSVIIQNSDDNQWSAFKYGLKMAAQDYKVDMFVVSTKEKMTVQEEESIIEDEIDKGAGAIIVQPVSDVSEEKTLKKMEKRVPVMLIEHIASQDGKLSDLPSTQPDNYELGKALAEELLKDYDGNIKGKTLGIVSCMAGFEAAINREKGFADAIKDAGAKISWSVYGPFPETQERSLEMQSKVNFVVALDDDSLTAAGKVSATNDLHGALVYGIGHSTEAIYYLDTGNTKCLVLPDEFNVGYQSLAEITKKLRRHFHKLQDKLVSYHVIRADTLFSKETQEILFTMSQ